MSKKELEEKIISLERRRGAKRITAVKDFVMARLKGREFN